MFADHSGAAAFLQKLAEVLANDRSAMPLNEGKNLQRAALHVANNIGVVFRPYAAAGTRAARGASQRDPANDRRCWRSSASTNSEFASTTA